MATKQAEKYKALGNEAFKKGEHGKAIEFYTFATECDPKNPVFYSNRAVAYAKMGKWEKSLRDSDKAIKYNSGWEKGWWRKGNALMALKRFDEAVVAYKEAVKLKPDTPQFANDLAKAKAAMMSDKTAAEVHKIDGNDLFKAGKIEEAVKAYTRAVNACETNTPEGKKIKADCLANRAACYRNLYNPDAVVKDCSEAIELNPGHFKAYIRRAQSYEALEKYQKSLSDFQTALTIAPGQQIAYQGVSRIRKAIKARDM